MATCNNIYNLKWNDFNAELSVAFGCLLEDADFIDVTLACENQSFSAHKVILSACSSYFKKLLRRNPCKHPIIILRDVSASVMDQIIHYMYYGVVDMPQETLPEFLATAQLLGVKGLVEFNSSRPDNSKKVFDDNSNSMKRRHTTELVQNQRFVSSPNKKPCVVSPAFKTSEKSNIILSEKERPYSPPAKRSMFKNKAPPPPLIPNETVITSLSSPQVSVKNFSKLNTNAEVSSGSRQTENHKKSKTESASDNLLRSECDIVVKDEPVDEFQRNDVEEPQSELNKPFCDVQVNDHIVGSPSIDQAVDPPSPLNDPVDCPVCKKVLNKNKLQKHISDIHKALAPMYNLLEEVQKSDLSYIEKTRKIVSDVPSEVFTPTFYSCKRF